MCEHEGRGVRAAAIVGFVMLTFLAGAAQARAATYHVFLCRIPYGPNAARPAPTDSTVFFVVGTLVQASDTCAAGGAMTATMDGGPTHPIGDSANVAYQMPKAEPLTIAAFTLWRHEAIGGNSPFQSAALPAMNIRYNLATSVEGVCTPSLSCFARGTGASPFAPGNKVAVTNLSGVTSVQWDASCAGTSGTCPSTGVGTNAALNEVFAADMVIEDGVAPVVTGLAGSLLAGGTLSGTQTVTFNATDAGSGVMTGSLLIDGTTVVSKVLDSAAGACADLGVAPDGRPSFVNTVPCPLAVNGLLSLDTDALSPGSHALTVLVADAAGNQIVANTSTISVRGAVPAGAPVVLANAPAVPANLAAGLANGANGAGASRVAKLTAGHSTTGKRARRLGFATAPTIAGRLVDESGKPIGAAKIEIRVRERRDGAPDTAVATVTTAADGSFGVALPSGPSRTITLSYTAFSGDPTPTSVVKLTTRVSASLTASASPRAPRTRQLLHVRGRLRYLPRRGVVVSIQARQGRTWRTVDTVETRKDGTYSWPYRFSASNAGHVFVFRARVKSPNYPFEPGTSKPFTVRVRR